MKMSPSSRGSSIYPNNIGFSTCLCVCVWGTNYMYLVFSQWLCFKETVIVWNNDLLISLIVQWFFCYRERVLNPIFPQGSIFLLSLWAAFWKEKKEKGKGKEKALCVSQLWSAWRSCWQLWRESYFWFNQQELCNISRSRMCAPKGSKPLRAAVSHSESAPAVHFELQGTKPVRIFPECLG